MSVDPFDLLNAMAGERDDAPLTAGEDPKAEALLRSIIDTDESATVAKVVAFKHRRTGQAILGAGVVLAVIGGGTVAALWIARRPADPVTLVCYSAGVVEPDETVGLQIDPSIGAIEQCGRLWRDGTLGTGSAPELAACVTDAEVTAVVPGSDQTCAELGLAVAAAPTPGDVLSAEVAAAVPELFGECIDDLDVAGERVAALLDELGASDWSVRVEGATSPDKPCAANSIDAALRTVVIIAFNPPTG
jgi:hypothetical protein